MVCHDWAPGTQQCPFPQELSQTELQSVSLLSVKLETAESEMLSRLVRFSAFGPIRVLPGPYQEAGAFLPAINHHGQLDMPRLQAGSTCLTMHTEKPAGFTEGSALHAALHSTASKWASHPSGRRNNSASGLQPALLHTRTALRASLGAQKALQLGSAEQRFSSRPRSCQ